MNVLDIVSISNISHIKIFYSHPYTLIINKQNNNIFINNFTINKKSYSLNDNKILYDPPIQYKKNIFFNSNKKQIKYIIRNIKNRFKFIENISLLKTFTLDKISKISIILAVYNTQNIDNAIESILGQSYKNIELIIVNDCSTDTITIQNINKYVNYKNIKIINLDKNYGVYYARNIGIKNASGDYITFQDADDLSLSYRIELELYYLVHKNVDFILTNSYIANIEFNKLKEFENNAIFIKNIEKKNIAMVTMFFHKSMVEKNGYFDENTKHSGDLEYLDRYYFNIFNKHTSIPYWDWLNNILYRKQFYYQLPIICYIISKKLKTNITSIYNKETRDTYISIMRNLRDLKQNG